MRDKYQSNVTEKVIYSCITASLNRLDPMFFVFNNFFFVCMCICEWWWAQLTWVNACKMRNEKPAIEWRNHQSMKLSDNILSSTDIKIGVFAMSMSVGICMVTTIIIIIMYCVQCTRFKYIHICYVKPTKKHRFFFSRLNALFISYGVIHSFYSLLIISFRYLGMWKACAINKF